MLDLTVDVMRSEVHRKAFGKRLKELRNQRRWTQKEVAARIDLRLAHFNKYESGMYVPPADKLLQLAEPFTTADYLLTGAVVVKHRVESAVQPVGKARGRAKGVA